jgi:RimJ/RimL family protein N-acetyltransferase
MPAPVVLEGTHVRLEPLTLDHVPDLFDALGGDEEVWRWIPGSVPTTIELMRERAVSMLAALEAGELTPFAVVHQGSGRAIGHTCYMDVPLFPESVEIGATCYSRAYWRSAVNTEAKLLLLGHAFDELGFDRVQLKTDCRNERSQNAIARLGCVREGTLRHQLRRRDGSLRDTVYFSLLAGEWPAARDRLIARMAQG